MYFYGCFNNNYVDILIMYKKGYIYNPHIYYKCLNTNELTENDVRNVQ